MKNKRETTEPQQPTPLRRRNLLPPHRYEADFPVDWDEQDRRAASEERLENLRNER